MVYQQLTYLYQFFLTMSYLQIQTQIQNQKCQEVRKMTLPFLFTLLSVFICQYRRRAPQKGGYFTTDHTENKNLFFSLLS